MKSKKLNTIAKLVLLLNGLGIVMYLTMWSAPVECDNIGEKCFPSSRNLPIDVVYTWVNGSDPLLQNRIDFYKELANNPDKTNTDVIDEKDNFKIFTGRSILNLAKKAKVKQEESNPGADSPFTVPRDCPIDKCIPAPAVVSVGDSSAFTLTLEDINKFVGFSKAIEMRLAKPENVDATLLFVKFPTIDDAYQAIGNVITAGSTTLQFKPIFYSPQHGDGPYVKTSSTLIDISACNIQKVTEISGVLSHDGVQSMVCVDKNSLWNIKHLCSQTYPQETYLVWPPWEKYSIGGLSSSDVGPHRFADNEELRYSLRSLYTYAPWARNVYIVTNGQIPHWLNTDHPRIKIVTHQEIFTNQSHLPTFSSPAIETSLHKIPGISEHFLYFNDDVILGRPVYPEDFISTEGYKVFLAWNIPNCNSGCPPNWLTDGYCDVVCNVSACNFDGGDCLNGGQTVVDIANSILNMGGSSYAQNYCNPGCSPSWICDKYCDPACNVEQCGFDAGDCGTTDIKAKLFEVNLVSDLNNTIVPVPQGVVVMYIDLTLHVDVVVSASYDTVDNSAVRTAAISLQHKILSCTFFPNKTESVKVTLMLKSKDKYVLTLSINSFPATEVYTKSMIVKDEVDVEDVEVEIWEIPETLDMNDLIDTSIMKVDEILNVVNFGERDVSAQRENTRLLNLVQEGLLTEKGRWFRLGLYIQNKERGSSEKRLVDPLVDSAENVLDEVEPNDHPQRSADVDDNSDYVKDSSKADAKPDLSGDLSPNADSKPDNELHDQADPDSFPSRKLQSVVRELIPQRRLLDSFADSLHHVNNMYTLHFGKEQRKVLAHMPFLINKNVASSLHAKFPEEFNKTASNKFRSSDDMQFAFSYYYYLIHAVYRETQTEFIENVDINKDGTLSTGELDILLTRVFPPPISEYNRTLFNDLLTNCSRECSLEKLTTQNIFMCPNVSGLVTKSLRNLTLYPHEIHDDKDVTFKMLKSNTTKVRLDLDYIRSRPKKFICLNDNMDHNSERQHINAKLLNDFYETMYPNPSPFEHRYGVRNLFLYKSEEHLGFDSCKMFLIFILLGLFVFLCFLKRRSFVKNCKNYFIRLTTKDY